MKLLIILFLQLLFMTGMLKTQTKPDFADYFNDQTMRIDYYHVGNDKVEEITLDKIYAQGIWAGTLDHLIDNFNNGRYYAKIYDKASGNLIFSKGFDSYFGEYQTSSDAAKGIKRTYHESVLIPYPKKMIRFALEKRNKQNTMDEIYSVEINPDDITIIRDSVVDKQVGIFKPLINGDPHTKVDIVILGEGYTAAEKNIFVSDLERFTKIHLNQEPYKTYKDKFNIYGVYKPSEESGTDEPDHGSFKNTVLNTTFYSLGSERYLLTEDNKTMRELASHVPYDAIYIMVNHKRYGGGGIYNLYCTFTTQNQWHEYLFIHEFGHSFTGLADEYYTSETSYNDFYPRGIEPVEPNITALQSPGGLKWKDLATPGIQIPTPWEKEQYDKEDYEYQKMRQKLNKEIAELTRNHAPADQIAKITDQSEQLSRERSEKAGEYLHKSKYWGQVGAFEGAGYSSEGLYRPMLDCIMFSRNDKFCKVCEQAIIRMIGHYSN